jgi:hypothetical protein
MKAKGGDRDHANTSGIAPSRASRHRAISSLRASATIMVLRV